MLPLLLLIPFVVAVLFFVISKTVCWREFLLVLGVVLLFNVAGMGLSFCGAAHDTEILNGSVTGKEKNRVSCSHSYQCRCRMVTSCTGSGKNRHCSTSQKCDTCYEHAYDIDWDVRTTVGSVTINRVDRQGLQEPERWTKVRIGEPASREHFYINYIKAAPGSVLRMNAQTGFETLLPKYPEVYDYYRANHIVTVGGASVPNQVAMQERLGSINGKLGPSKEVDIIFVVAKVKDPAYHYALQQHWLGGKKNDLIVILGVPNDNTVEWATVMSWSDAELLKVQLRDAILEIGTLDRFLEMLDVTEQMVGKQFHRKPMEDFAYLRYQYSPSPGIMMLLLFLGVAISVGLSIYFVHNDPFDSGFSRHPYRRF